ncbi:hypothetical protein [Mesorhizobium sp. B2-3-4]|nr:hypothetical protein [Mesorhizobium sp. B2-3-4]
MLDSILDVSEFVLPYVATVTSHLGILFELLGEHRDADFLSARK